MKPSIESSISYLVQSDFTPPPWVFMVVWPLLYGLMGAAMLINPKTKVQWSVFLAQLGLNIIWQWVFFQQKALMSALILCAGLTAMNVWLLISFRDSRAAFYLFSPYVGWLSFATYLMLVIVWFNPI